MAGETTNRNSVSGGVSGASGRMAGGGPVEPADRTATRRLGYGSAITVWFVAGLAGWGLIAAVVMLAT